MIDLRWLAAILCPRDVAPHPNFFSEDQIEPSSLLALAIQGRGTDYQRVTRGIGEVAPRYIVSGSAGDQVHDFAMKALSVGTVADGARGLAALVGGVSEDLDPAAEASSAIVAAVAFAELEKVAEALQVLWTAVEHVESKAPDDPNYGFIKAILLVQIAMRLLENGESDARPFVQEAGELLSHIKVSQLARFKITRAVRHGSSSTLKMIRDALMFTIESNQYIAGGLWPSGNWRRLLSSQTPTLTLIAARDASSGFAAFAERFFGAKVLASGSEFSWTSEDKTDTPVWRAAIQAELLGDHVSVQRWRSQLGKIRMSQAPTGVDDWRFRDSVRLFRQGEDVASLDKALRFLEISGPLSAIAYDARLIMGSRIKSVQLRNGELAVLGAAAELLNESEAGIVYDMLLNCLTGAAPPHFGGWEAPVVRYEKIWKALASAAAVARRSDDLARMLLQQAEEWRESNELVDRAFAGAASSLNWTELSDTTVASWRAWLRATNRQNLVLTSDVVSRALGTPGTEENPVDRPITAFAVASLLNSRILHPENEPPGSRVDSAVEFVVTRMSEERAGASEGRFGLGGIPIGDLAAGLALYVDAERVWQPLVGYLLDINVPRQSRSTAFDRLVREEGRLPEYVRSELALRLPLMLESQMVMPFEGPELVPYPEALRLALVLGVFDENRSLLEIARLAGDERPDARLEALRTLTVLVRRGSTPRFVTALVLQLSHDAAPTVRAEAGRALALLSADEGEMRSFLGARLEALLLEEGVLVPLLVLRGLSEAGAELVAPVAIAIETLAAGHTARSVRMQAQAVDLAQRQRGVQ